ncbi:MAG: hypothetical protein EOO89_10330 [Pedobacter sp.]|nr:MAG: hypothetical protein EOO89_10330 [Pedobacter sp.]
MTEQEKNTSESIARTNDPSIYKMLVVGIIFSMLGAYLRFAFDSTILSIVSWVILFIGAFICCKAVFKMLDK